MPWEEQWLKGRRGSGQKVGTKVGQGVGLTQVGTSGGRGGDEPHLPRGRIPLGSQSQQGQAWRRCQHGEKTGRGGWGPVGAGGAECHGADRSEPLGRVRQGKHLLCCDESFPTPLLLDLSYLLHI